MNTCTVAVHDCFEILGSLDQAAYWVWSCRNMRTCLKRTVATEIILLSMRANVSRLSSALVMTISAGKHLS